MSLPARQPGGILIQLAVAAARRRRTKLRLELAGSISPGTQASYVSDQRVWTKWAEAQGLNPFVYGPREIEAWVCDQFDQGLSRSIIERRVAALAWFAEQSGAPYPIDDDLRKTLKGVRRERGIAPKRPVRPLTRAILLKALPLIPDIEPLTRYEVYGSRNEIAKGQRRVRVQTAARLAALRDRAILLLGHASGLRRIYLSQLVLTPVNRREINAPPELKFIQQGDARGIEITIHKSKTDQLGEGFSRVIAEVPGDPLCAVTAVRTWLDEAGIKEGPVFQTIGRGGKIGRLGRKSGEFGPISDQMIALIVKAAARRAGEDPKLFAGHSLRAGLVTDLLDAGVDPFKVADSVDHKHLATTRKYDRRAQRLENSTSKAFTNLI